MSVQIIQGDSREQLPLLAADSIDAVITDPPYALVSITKRWSGDGPPPREGVYRRSTAGFMGKAWDTGETAFDPAFWSEVLRVMKPGAHLLAMGGDRTYHRLVCAVEDAGFEIRGSLAYLYGSGFPKSHNITEKLKGSLPADALRACGRCDWQTVRGSQCDCPECRDSDDAQPRSQEATGLSAAPSQADAHGHSRADPLRDDLDLGPANTFLGEGSARHSNAGSLRQSARRSKGCQSNDNTLFGNAESTSPVVSTAARRTAESKSGTAHSGGGGAGSSACLSSERYSHLPQCQTCGKRGVPNGLGTALKPAMELIVMARKPLSEGTIAANVLKHGTGALNIDACRVEAPEGLTAGGRNGTVAFQAAPTGAKERTEAHSLGRWPANVIHDGSPEVLAGFPSPHGAGHARDGSEADVSESYSASSYMLGANRNMRRLGDEGSAARFFYTPKADKADRCLSKHPTVKPIDLMAYLIKLVTPPGGTVLDPFAGSGSTGMAAMREGFNAILIEREAEYVRDIQRRLNHVHGHDTPLFADLASQC